jgi:3D (Asp-Asp-Asp) domain-containing protein
VRQGHPNRGWGRRGRPLLPYYVRKEVSPLTSIVAGLALLASVAWPPSDCTLEPEAYRITGYVRGHGNPWTYDGTSVWSREKIAAGSWNLPLGTVVSVEGLDFLYRIADRGRLFARHVDVLVDSVPEAYALETWVGGKFARVCIMNWGG